MFSALIKTEINNSLAFGRFKTSDDAISSRVLKEHGSIFEDCVNMMDQSNIINQTLTLQKMNKKSIQSNRRCPNYALCGGKGNVDKNKNRHFLTKNCPKNEAIPRFSE